MAWTKEVSDVAACRRVLRLGLVSTCAYMYIIIKVLGQPQRSLFDKGSAKWDYLNSDIYVGTRGGEIRWHRLNRTKLPIQERYKMACVEIFKVSACPLAMNRIALLVFYWSFVL